MYNEYIDGYGLTNSRPDEKNAENAFPWTLQTIKLEEKAGTEDTQSQARILCFKRSMEKARVSPGLFHQNPSYADSGPLIAHDAYMSPDQLVSLVLFSYSQGLDYHKEIWSEIKRQGFKYDNVNPDDPERYIHPRDLILYGYCASSTVAKLCISIVAIACIISCLRKRSETSGKLLSWLKCEFLQEKSFTMRIAYKVCNLLIKMRHKSWLDVFSIYFPFKDHPNVVLAKQVYE